MVVSLKMLQRMRGRWKGRATSYIEAIRHDPCVWCGEFPRPGEKHTIEHLVPKSEGGKREWHNVVAACSRCNNKRGVMPPAIFLILRLWTTNPYHMFHPERRERLLQHMEKARGEWPITRI